MFPIILDTRTGKFGYSSSEQNLTREEIKSKCANPTVANARGYYCTMLIMYDGWEIRDDYPYEKLF